MFVGLIVGEGEAPNVYLYSVVFGPNVYINIVLLIAVKGKKGLMFIQICKKIRKPILKQLHTRNIHMMKMTIMFTHNLTI